MANTLIFLGSTPTNASQLFTLGTTANTAVVSNLGGYSGTAGPEDFTACNGGEAFNGGALGAQVLWGLSGSGIAAPITTSALSPDLDPLNLTAVGTTLFFSGTDAAGNNGLFTSDGTSGGTHEIAAANAAASGLSPDEIVSANGKAFFSGIDASGSTGLWLSNGTAAGTMELAVANTDTQDISQLGAGLNPTNITVANGQIFFAGTDASGSIGLWKSDGTGAGTVELSIGNAAEGGINPTTSNIVSFNGLTYFAGQDASGNIGLWVTDGSGGDTHEIGVNNASSNGLAPVSLTVFNGALYFGGTDASGNTGLWKSDGTTAGTTELAVSGTAPGGLAPSASSVLDYTNVAMTVFNNRLYFAGSGADGTDDLWSSDGTGAGTVQVATPDTAGTATGVLPTDFAVLGLGTASTNTVVSAVAPLTLGAGHDTISFLASEDAYAGDAQFTISVDGKQVGGVLTETALRSQSQAQLITLNGDWGNGTHTLTLNFLNDAYGGPGMDRNLYASTVTYNSVSASGSLALLGGGPQSLTIGTAAPGTTTLGSGSDSVTLQMAEDAFNGNAQFIATVDGVQIGGIQTVTASHSAGQMQQFNLLGNFGPGSHTVGVDFINDAAGSTAVQDRNLYVDSTSFDGVQVAQGALAEFSGGTQTVATGVAATPVAQNLQIGNNGQDMILLKVSEDYFVGDAQFTVAVDGKQIGGVVTAQDSHAAGLDQTLLVVGNFGPGTHQVAVDFLNDLSGPNIATEDRNLYVDGASFDGSPNAGSLALLSAGTQAITVGTPDTPTVSSVGSGYDALALKVSQDFYQGNAQFTVAVDGVQIGGVQTASALHASGQDSTLDVLGNFGGGQHTLSVSFLNDAYGGSAATDRNLYVDGTSYNGAAGGSMVLLGTGTMSEVVGTARQSTVSLGSGSDVIALKVSEDYFQGDAQFTLAVDGKAIGGTQTASAQHAAGQDTTYDLYGSFGPGQHQVSVDFHNDDSGPNIATQDRNLYVDGASFDGAATPGATLALLGQGTQTLTTGSSGTNAISLGAGPDTITLKMSEDFFAGDAQYTLAVDGKAIGGVLTASGLHGTGQEQTVNLSGTFGPGQHAVSVDFLNDAYAGPGADRNLYVDGASYDGVTTPGASLTLLAAGTQTVAVGTTTAAVTVGSGSDTVGLMVSEDYFQGNAQFTISVDGHQVGGVQTAGAVHGSQDQAFNVLGNFGAGGHLVSLDFLNDANGPTGDRNLYVDGTTFDGKAVANGAIEIPAAVPGSIAIPGATTLTLHMSEDAYAGDAQYDVYVDGQQVGGTMTATASHAAGQTQTVNLAGSWAAGGHTVGVTFLNDAYGGSPSLNRNLYVDAVGFNGATTAQNFEIGVNGGANFNATTATTYAPGAGGGTVATLGNDTVNAGAGFVTIGTNGPTTLVNGGSGGMQFFGNTGSATVIGGSGAVQLIGSGGNLAFTDGTGATSIAAGFAKEVYNIVNGQASNTLDLYNFNPSNDHVHLQGYSGTGISSEQVSGGSTQIVLADNTKIVLHGVTTLANSQIFA